MTGNTNIWLNGVMGVVVGDALGCPVQFESRREVAGHPVTGMRGYGTFNLPEGSWTDDSSLTIALLESIGRLSRIDLDDIMENFMKWLYDGGFTPYGYSYDVGRGTMQAIGRYKRNRKAQKCGGEEEWNNGNGSLMRILPAARLYFGSTCCWRAYTRPHPLQHRLRDVLLYDRSGDERGGSPVRKAEGRA